MSEGYRAVYRVQGIERTTSDITASSQWTLRFVRYGEARDHPDVIEITIPSALFAGLDLDTTYLLEQVDELQGGSSGRQTS